MTDPRADGLGVSTCIELALKDARIEKEQVNYINAHATSTLVGDVAEVKAVRKVFTETKGIAMNGTKSMIGHCLGAAGGMEAVATIQAIRTGWVRNISFVFNLFSFLVFRGWKKKSFAYTHSFFFPATPPLPLCPSPSSPKTTAGPPHDQPGELDRRGRRHRHRPQRQEGAQGDRRHLQLFRVRRAQLGRRFRAVRGLGVVIERDRGCFILRERARERERERERATARESERASARERTKREER